MVWILWSLLTLMLRGDSQASNTFVRCLESPLVATEFFCLPIDYRKDVPPTGKSAVNVYVNLPVSEISAIDDKHSQISIRLYYKLLWPEPRMILNQSADWSQGQITVGSELIEHFWTPDIIIHDLVEFNKPEVVKEIAALQIRKENSVYYKLRADLTVVCREMAFRMYPFDKHLCHLKMTSFGHNVNALVLNGGFTYTDANQRELSFMVNIREKSGHAGIFRGKNANYSMYALEIHLSRYFTPYLLNVYFPTGIFVVMSWVSFIIPAEVIAARVTLLVTLCLVLINSFNSVTDNIPNARQETALEYWICGCIALVFAALTEYAFILFKMAKLRRSLRRKRLQAEEGGRGHRHRLPIKCPSEERPKWRDTLRTNYQSDGGDGSFNGEFKQRMAKIQLDLDENAWRLYPLLFVVFSVWYWTYYFVIAEHDLVNVE